MKPRSANSQGRGDFAAAESGFALPTVLLGMLAVFGLGTAMVATSIGASSGSTRDIQSKSAFGVAEAGISAALMRYNRVTTTEATPCVTEDGANLWLTAPEPNATPDTADDWCAPSTGNAAGGTYSYSVLPDPGGIVIVSTGDFGGIDRRVQVGTEYSENPGAPGQAVFADAQIKTHDYIHIGPGARITGDVATYGDLTISNGAKLYCDQAQANSVTGDPCLVTDPSFDFPPVDSSAYALTNDNASLPSCWSKTGTPPRISISGTECSLGVAGQTRNFYLCKMSIGSGKRLNVTGGANVNVWFAPPEQCANELVPFVVTSGAKIQTPGDATLALLVSDSPTVTSMDIDAGGQWDSDLELIIYAPTTTFDLSSGPHLFGAIAGKNLQIANGATVTKTAGASSWVLPGTEGEGTPHFTMGDFIECRPTNASAVPDAGC
jgi:type II secretory pathway pseudopilin PulG